MKPSRSNPWGCASDRGHFAVAIGMLLFLVARPPCAAHEDYSGCKPCHGDFRGSTSPKGTIFPNGKNHDMHRNSGSMATSCNLCHTGDSTTRTPVYIGRSNGTGNNPGIGCTGCHVQAGLIRHHVINGVTECLDCHALAAAPPENVPPPYYGTPDTRVRNPGNEIQVANTNENWSIGDFLGLDNDGNNLYDLADYAIGPFQILGIAREGQDIRISWLTARGRTNVVEAAASISGGFTNLSGPVGLDGVGLLTNEFVHVGGATTPRIFYRVAGQVP